MVTYENYMSFDKQTKKIRNSKCFRFICRLQKNGLQIPLKKYQIIKKNNKIQSFQSQNNFI